MILKHRGAEIRRMLTEGKSYNDIAQRLQCSKATINYQAKKLGIAKQRSIYDWADVQKFYDEGHSRLECIAHFGFCTETWSAAIQRGELKVKDWRIPLDDLLVQDRHQTARSHVKLRMFKAGLLKDECYECGLTSWRGKPISLNLHHINGDGKDNRLENLTLLCPNCHSQTENFAGKNKTGETRQLLKEKNLYAGETL